MFEYIQQNEPQVRLVFFFGILLMMALWETLAPRRSLSQSRSFRTLNNLALVMLNTVLLRVIFPGAAVGVAVFAQSRGWGILSITDWSISWAVFISVVVMDFMIWLQHVVVHAIPALWRLHRVHHADRDYDVTTGLRFHPFEIILSMLIKFAVIIALGPPVVAVIIFEIVLNGMAMFNHGNVRIPAFFDRLIKVLFVTPDMHRVHHSIEDFEANSNFGFNLSIWDRLFGTYVDQPEKGHQNMQIGIDGFTQRNLVNRLDGMLMLPFKGHAGDYVINRRSWKRPDKQEK